MTEPFRLPPAPAPPRWNDRLDSLAAALGVERRRVVAGGVVVLIVGVLVAGVAVFRSLGGAASGAPAELSLPRASPRSTTTDASASPGAVVVAAAGAVARPGVYKLKPGARVFDVVDAAGGAGADADLDRVNLAAKVTDGQRIYVPRKGEPDAGAVDGPEDASDGTGASAIVDLNTATAAELEGLPGVGPATAQAILEYRKQRGRFRSVDELLEVRGIGEAKLAQLRPHVRVS